MLAAMAGRLKRPFHGAWSENAALQAQTISLIGAPLRLTSRRLISRSKRPAGS